MINFCCLQKFKVFGELKPSTKYYVATPLWSVPLSNFSYVQKYTSGRECVLSTCHKELPKRSPGRAGVLHLASPCRPRGHAGVAEVLFLSWANTAAPVPRLRYLVRTFSVLTSAWGGGGGGGDLAVRRRGILALSCGGASRP